MLRHIWEVSKEMNKETIVNGIKEKGPAFLFGALVGAVVIAAFVNRDKIAKTMDNVLGRRQQSVVKDEYPGRS
jgi:hypothetical protein